MIPLAARHQVEIDLRDTAKPIAGIRDFRDPVDGRRYVVAGSDHLGDPSWFSDVGDGIGKAPVTVELRCPPGWTVVGVGPRTYVAEGHWLLDSVRPLAAHLVGLAAGPMHEAQRAGHGVGLYARRSLAHRLDRDAAALASAAVACREAIASLVGMEYPWPTCEFVFVPGSRRRAMEYPGGVQLREALLPAAPLGPSADAARVVVLAHELAHMWFGNLVTPRGARDVWLFEALAELLGQHTARAVAGDAVRGVVARRRMTALRAAGRADAPALGGGGVPSHVVDYVKGAAALTDLCAKLGTHAFTEGLHTMLHTHRDGVASADELIAHWSESNRRTVARWRRDWLGHRGRWRHRAADATDRRAGLWSALQADVAQGRTSPAAALEAAVALLAEENDDAIFDAAAQWVIDVLLWQCAVDGEHRVRGVLQRVLADSAVGPARLASAMGYWIEVADAEPLLSLCDRLGPEMRWRAAARLAALGHLAESDVEEMSRQDFTPEGAVHAARCRASLPGGDAKERAWRFIIDPVTPVAERVAAARVFFHPRHRSTTATFVPRYIEALRQGGIVADVLARYGFPYAAEREAVALAVESAFRDRDIDEGIRTRIAAAAAELRLSRRLTCAP